MTSYAIASVVALARKFRSRQGQSLVEYALVLSFISVLTVAVMSVLGVQIQALFVPIISAVNAARLAIGG